MKPSDFIALTGSLAATATAFPSHADAGEQNTGKPNFVIMIADDCSYYDWGCYGSKDAITPNIDRLASESMKFNKCFQQAPMSSPTRHALYTGVYPVKSGAYPNHTFVYDDVKSFVQYFEPAGYKTALIGKQHVQPESVFAYEYLGDYSPRPKDNDNLKFGKLEKWLDRTGSDPFFLVVASHEPHSPWNMGDPSQWDPESITVPPIYVDTPETRSDLVNYYAEINFFDKQVGRVLDILDEKGVAENTVFMLLSEQGNSFPFAKWTCYRNGLQSAMLVRWPGKVKAASQSDAIVEYVDVVPTFMDIAGIGPSEQADGTSFRNVLTGRAKKHKKYSYGLQTSRGIISGPEYYGIRTVKDKRFNYIMNLTPEARFRNVVTADASSEGKYWPSWVKAAETDRFAAHQVRKYQFRPAEELYDMVNDPWETNNLANDPRYRSKKTELRKALLEWMNSQGDRGQETEMEAKKRLFK